MVLNQTFKEISTGKRHSAEQVSVDEKGNRKSKLTGNPGIVFVPGVMCLLLCFNILFNYLFLLMKRKSIKHNKHNLHGCEFNRKSKLTAM
jgi:hypothetical protein